MERAVVELTGLMRNGLEKALADRELQSVKVTVTPGEDSGYEFMCIHFSTPDKKRSMILSWPIVHIYEDTQTKTQEGTGQTSD